MNKINYIANKQYKKLKVVLSSMTEANKPRTHADLVTELSGFDPTPNKEYLQWLVNEFIAGSFLLEDKTFLYNDLTIFHTHKRVLKPEVRDINKSSYRELKFLVDSIEAGELVIQTPDDEVPGLIPVAKDLTLSLFIVSSFETAELISKGTRWCTGSAINTFQTYSSEDSPLYFIRHRGEKYQYHFESGSFMDSSDDLVETEVLADMFKTSSVFREFIKAEIVKPGSPDILLELANEFIDEMPKNPKLYMRLLIRNFVSKLTVDQLAIVALDPLSAITYAVVTELAFKEAEPVIAKDAFYSCVYSFHVLNTRFELGEEVIRSAPEFNKAYSERWKINV